jgi:hypothetical protein
LSINVSRTRDHLVRQQKEKKHNRTKRRRKSQRIYQAHLTPIPLPESSLVLRTSNNRVHMYNFFKARCAAHSSNALLQLMLLPLLFIVWNRNYTYDPLSWCPFLRRNVMVLAIASNLSWVGPSTCKRCGISFYNTSIIGNRSRERISTIHQLEVSTDEARKMRTYT